MFVNSIERVGSFTRPIFTIAKTFGAPEIITGSSTLFFVNSRGDAVTNKATAKLIVEAAAIEKKYQEYKEGTIAYSYKGDELVQMKVRFMDCVDTISQVQCRFHPHTDLAAIRFEGYNELKYNGYAVFAADGNEARPGQILCRLGFPFPEFTNYVYDESSDEIHWSNDGIKNSPRFPFEGMVTRFISPEGNLEGLEMSTPGFEGMEGGPLFDNKGMVHGMQCGINRHGLGQCVHSSVIKRFLKREGIPYYTQEKESKGQPFNINLACITSKNGRYLQ